MEHKIKVVMLPTEDKSHLYQFDNKSLHIGNYDICHPDDKDRVNQHLYATVSLDVESIKYGDWVMWDNHIWQFLGEYSKEGSMLAGEIELNSLLSERNIQNNGMYLSQKEEKSRKIIATTDPKLLLHSETYCKTCCNTRTISKLGAGTMKCPKCITPTPQVQQSFLKEFVANPDGEYEVEYIKITEHTGDRDDMFSFKDVLVINPEDNTVNITAVEEKMYSREEVIAFIESHTEFIDKAIDYDGILNATTAISCPEWEDMDWIKENL
tara:strand:- start:569 stop:1369 length:801 start_codon:yes stop_codon:yes gene_type:complete